MNEKHRMAVLAVLLHTLAACAPTELVVVPLGGDAVADVAGNVVRRAFDVSCPSGERLKGSGATLPLRLRLVVREHVRFPGVRF